MADKNGVFRMNISIPRQLKRRMDDVKNPPNWSAVAGKAFQAKLLELESTKEAKDMKSVIERLRAAAQLEADEDYQAGFLAGKQWAEQTATPKQLHRVDECLAAGTAWAHVDADSCAPYGLGGWFAIAVRPELRRDEIEQWWDSVLGHGSQVPLKEPGFLRGFGEGALDVWRKVKDKL